MLRRLFIVLQVVGVIPIIFFWFLWLIQNKWFWMEHYFPFWLVSSHILYLLSLLGKYIVYGKLHLYKIPEENKLSPKEEFYDNLGREVLKIEEEEENKIVSSKKKVTPTEQELYETNLKKHTREK
jgi:hypothetical protein